jgi:cold shock CspA family protein
VSGPVPSARPRRGRVTSFDPTRGLGTVTADDGTEFGFHATAIADGSRAIAEQTEVVFTAIPGHRGRYEARWLAPVAAPAGSSSHQPST